LTIALVAVLGETLTDLLEPWPIKIVVDNILQSKELPPLLGGIVTGLFGLNNTDAIVNFAVAAVAFIAIVGALSSHFEKYLTTSVSQWVAHDLRRTLYHHIQLSRQSICRQQGGLAQWEARKCRAIRF